MPPRAMPAVRALAQKLGVDLAMVAATGPDGSISRDDVERAARAVASSGPGEAVRGMRRAMARRMAQAHAEVVPAGVMDEADIGDWAPTEDISIRVVRAIATAAKSEPALNAHYSGETGTRHILERIDLGIAVDTEDGLIVPVLRNIGTRDAKDLRAGLDRMRAAAKSRNMPPAELQGATISLSNFGMFGGRFAHLVIVPPQVAIIGVGRIAEAVLPHHGVPAVRKTSTGHAVLRPPHRHRRRGRTLSCSDEARPRIARPRWYCRASAQSPWIRRLGQVSARDRTGRSWQRQ